MELVIDGDGGLPLVVCANKVDKRRQVTEAEGKAWAAAHAFPYFETSAQSGANVTAVFESLFETVFQQITKAGR